MTISTLRDELPAGRPAHAYLLCCAEPERLRQAALRLGQALNCLKDDPGLRPCGECRPCVETAHGTFADFAWSSARKVADVRADLARLQQKPYVGRSLVLTLGAASEMTREAHNTLLKTLEEPPPAAVLILLVRSPDDVPATVASRCRKIVLGATPWALIAERMTAEGVDPRTAAFAAACSGGDERAAREWAGRDDLEDVRAAAVNFVRSLLGPTRSPPLEVVERHQRYFGSAEETALWLAALGCALGAAIGLGGAGQDSLRTAFTGRQWETLAEIDPLGAADLARGLHQVADAVHRHAQVRLSLEAALLRQIGFGSGGAGPAGAKRWESDAYSDRSSIPPGRADLFL